MTHITRWMRALASIVLVALAAASVATAGHESHPWGFASGASSSSVATDAAYRQDLAASVDHPIQPATLPSLAGGPSFLSTIRLLEGDTRATGFTPPLGHFSDVVGPGCNGDLAPTVLPAADVWHSAVLLRTGAISAFTTSLPPPPHA